MSDEIFNEIHFPFVLLNMSNITTQKQTEYYRLYICILLINYHLKNTHKPFFSPPVSDYWFSNIFFLNLCTHFLNIFIIDITFKTKVRISNFQLISVWVYSNMLTSTKSTGGREAADVSREEEEDEGLSPSSQEPPWFHANMNLHFPPMRNSETTIKI